MDYLLNYIRNLIGLGDDRATAPPNFKRDRTDDDVSTDEDIPSFKRHKTLMKSVYPVAMSYNDEWDKKTKPVSKVRYVPIQIESDHPSTSTPNLNSEKLSNRVRSVPIKFVDITDSRSEQFTRKPRVHTPVRPVIHAVIDDEDDEPEVSIIESKPEKSTKSNPKYYINLEDGNEQPEDVIFVKKVKSPPPLKPYKYFISENCDGLDTSREYYNAVHKLNHKTSSPNQYSKFKTPAGITKSYKKAPAPVAKWMQHTNSMNLYGKNRFTNLNGNAKSAISELFNLEEKRNYQKLIQKVSSRIKHVSSPKPIQVINLTDEAASFRSTQRAQKKALQGLNLTEKGLEESKDREYTKEYDPLTVASITSSDSDSVEVIPSGSSTTSSIRIEPVNSLRDSHKDIEVTGDEWLLKILTQLREGESSTRDKLKLLRRENDIASKFNHDQNLARIERKLKNELIIPESVIEEPPPALALPELTAEQEKLVNQALGPGPGGQLLVEKFNLRIHRRDLQTLAGLNWLNDEVINFYMNLLMQRSEERKDLPKVYATNTFFYPKLMQSGQAGLKRWTRKVDIFAHDLMVVPVHLGVHWCLSLIDFRSKKISYLDSMGRSNKACLEALLKYLKDEHQDKKGQPFEDSGWSTQCLSREIPQQMNGSDCGMFACTFAEFSSRDAPYTFTQDHMPYMRRKAALEILQGKLLL